MATKISIEIPGLTKMNYELTDGMTQVLKRGGVVSFTFGAFEREEFVAKCEAVETQGKLVLLSST